MGSCIISPLAVEQEPTCCELQIERGLVWQNVLLRSRVEGAGAAGSYSSSCLSPHLRPSECHAGSCCSVMLGGPYESLFYSTSLCGSSPDQTGRWLVIWGQRTTTCPSLGQMLLLHDLKHRSRGSCSGPAAGEAGPPRLQEGPGSLPSSVPAEPRY